MRTRILKFASIVFFFAVSSSAATIRPCDVVIIGGGPAGIHTAYQLAPTLKAQSVCLFEKEDHLGGRVGNNYPIGLHGAITGAGGYRVHDNQYTFVLGQELKKKGARLSKPVPLDFILQSDFKTKLVGLKNPNGVLGTFFSYDQGAVAQLYHAPISWQNMLTKLMCGPWIPRRNNVPQYEDISGIKDMSMYDYLRWASKQVEPKNADALAQYVIDSFVFKSLFTSRMDAVSVLDHLATESVEANVYYPKPSFGAFFDIMENDIVAHKQRIYKERAVLSVAHTGDARYPYKLVVADANDASLKQEVRAKRVVIAIGPPALQQLSGDVIEELKRKPEFNALSSGNAVTITYQFGDGKTPSSGFWNLPKNVTYPKGPRLLGDLPEKGTAIRESLVNVAHTIHTLPPGPCEGLKIIVNRTELPFDSYHDEINVARMVYVDDDEAVEGWKCLYEHGGIDAVSAQLLPLLQEIYPTVFKDMQSLPHQDGINAHFQVHNPAWSFLKTGALKKGISNASLFEWSKNPLGAHEQVWLVGGVWRPDLAPWSDGAYVSSIYLLNEKFGFNIDPIEPHRIDCSHP